MVQAISGKVAREGRSLGLAMGSGKSRWRTDYFGGASGNSPGVEMDSPQAFLVDMQPESTIEPHFHEVDQFQVLVAGSGRIGRGNTPLIALHYVDHHTGYGPLVSGKGGLSFFTIRARRDSGPVYLSNPKHRDLLKPTKKRYVVAADISLSTEPVMESRPSVLVDNLFPETDTADGLTALILRAGAGATVEGPPAEQSSGQYFLVVNGSLEIGEADYPVWSLIFVSPADGRLISRAGPGGVEVLVLGFPSVPVNHSHANG
jgi:hypothetical protein